MLRIRIRMCFGPPGSGSICMRYGSGSDPYNQAKIVKNTQFLGYYFVTSLWLIIFENDVKVASKSFKLNFLFVIFKVTDEKSRIRIRIR